MILLELLPAKSSTNFTFPPHLEDRARVLSSLEAVDAVIIFDEETPIKLIQRIKPNFLIKGSDYKLTEVVGHKEVTKWGGKVKLVELLAGN